MLPSLLYHSYSVTITSIPQLQCFHHSITMATVLPSLHYHSYSVAIPPLPQLQSCHPSITTATVVPSLHYHSYSGAITRLPRADGALQSLPLHHAQHERELVAQAVVTVSSVVSATTALGGGQRGHQPRHLWEGEAVAVVFNKRGENSRIIIIIIIIIILSL